MNFASAYLESPIQAAIALLSSAVVIASGWLIYDYNEWVSFGTGGTPPNVRGYLKITKLRLFRAWSGDRLDDASSLPSDGLSHLPGRLSRRSGKAPAIISRTLPQRQRPAPLDDDIRRRLHALPALYAQRHPHLLVLDKSITEGRSTDAIYTKPGLPGRRHTTQDRVLGNEIAHVHPAENSLHVWLTQTDARKVVEAGWGLRFPLASLGMCDAGWTFVYAPRTMEEVEVVESIVRAGISHLTGEQHLP